MNIHFTDTELKEQLESNALTKTIVGSHLYKLNNKDSDFDILTIYKENNNSFLWEHHQLQYNTEDDLLFTSLNTFIRNILTGDSTINFEVLMSDELYGTELEFLIQHRKEFITYNLIKSYLGLAKRDFKNRKDPKKLSHFLRGVYFAEMLMNSNFKLFDYEGYEDVKSAKEGTLLDKEFIAQSAELKMLELRTELNNRLKSNKISLYPSTKTLKEIETKCINLQSDAEHIDYKDIILDSLSGINY